MPNEMTPPDFRLTAFRRRDAGGNRVDNGRPFGVELTIDDWADQGGACPVTFSVVPAGCVVAPTGRAVDVVAGQPARVRMQLTVLGAPGTLAMITATTISGHAHTLAVMLRGRRA